MRMYPDEDSVGEVSNSPPHVPVHYMNGFRDWHIVMDPDGTEVIELATSDEEDEPDVLGGDGVLEPVAHDGQDEPAINDIEPE